MVKRPTGGTATGVGIVESGGEAGVSFGLQCVLRFDERGSFQSIKIFDSYI